MVGDGEHVVQFYDHDADLMRAAGDYLTRAVSEGGAAIVIATESHRHAFEAELADGGIDVARAVASGSLVWLDAAETLARFVHGGVADPVSFRAALSPVVRRADRCTRHARRESKRARATPRREKPRECGCQRRREVFDDRCERQRSLPWGDPFGDSK